MSFSLMMKQRWSQKGRRLSSWKLKHSKDLVNAENTRLTCFQNLKKKTIQEATHFWTFYTDENQLNISNSADFSGVKTDNNSFKLDKQLANLSLAKILFLIRRPLKCSKNPAIFQVINHTRFNSVLGIKKVHNMNSTFLWKKGHKKCPLPSITD